jgi:hypothetical protein
MFSLKSKLLACKHANTNAYNYVRDDGLLDEALYEKDPKRLDNIKMHLTGMRFCLDCGSTQRFKRWDPLSITDKNEKEPWLAPWMWRKL